jgi:cellulose 1,4-beta-cellobiosidase
MLLKAFLRLLGALVVIQFIGSPLTEIKRLYVPEGRLFPNSQCLIPNVIGNSITSEFYNAQKAALGDNYTFKKRGSLANIGTALEGGMVLVMSVWTTATPTSSGSTPPTQPLLRAW